MGPLCSEQERKGWVTLSWYQRKIVFLKECTTYEDLNRVSAWRPSVEGWRGGTLRRAWLL